MSTQKISRPPDDVDVSVEPSPIEISLTVDMIRESAGTDNLEEIDSIELIFSPVHRLAALDRCIRLRKLTLISTSLRSLEGLQPVRESLVRLCITSQPTLTHIGALDLPNLKDLLLHNNAIESMDGLHGVPRVQRLWLFSNRIRTMGGLDGLGDLRELWIQDNRLTRIRGVEHLVNLQVLNLAANPIADLRDVQKLTHLPRLKSLSFSDPHFGACPILDAEGYRPFLLASLPALVQLDGFPVDDSERVTATHHFLESGLRFGRSVDQLFREQEGKLLALRARRQRNRTAAATCQAELSSGFHRIERVVRSGRAKIDAEVLRCRKARRDAGERFEARLEAVERAHAEWTQRVLEEERRLEEADDLRFAWLIHKSQLEESQEELWLGRDGSAGRRLVAQRLPEHGPQFRWLARQATEWPWDEPNGGPALGDPASTSLCFGIQVAPSEASAREETPEHVLVWLAGSNAALRQVVREWPRVAMDGVTWTACSALRGALEVGFAQVGDETPFLTTHVLGVLVPASHASGVNQSTVDSPLDALEAAQQHAPASGNGILDADCWVVSGTEAWRWWSWRGPWCPQLEPVFFLTAVRSATSLPPPPSSKFRSPDAWALATKESPGDPIGVARHVDASMAALWDTTHANAALCAGKDATRDAEEDRSGAAEESRASTGPGRDAGLSEEGIPRSLEACLQSTSGWTQVATQSQRAVQSALQEYTHALWHEAQPEMIEAVTEADEEYVELSDELERLRNLIERAKNHQEALLDTAAQRDSEC